MLYFNTTQFSAFWFSVARTTGNPVYATRKPLVTWISENTRLMIRLNRMDRKLDDITGMIQKIMSKGKRKNVPKNYFKKYVLLPNNWIISEIAIG